MALNINKLFADLFENFLNAVREVDAVLISDREGLIIAGEKRENIDMELVSVLTTVVNPILERIRDEFAFKKFGTASFDTDEHRLLFVSVDETTTISLVISPLGYIDKIYPYAYFLAEKSAQIIKAQEGEIIQLSIPNFEYEAQQTEKLKNLIYQMRLGTGGLYRFKFIIIGDHEVGKTSIIRRYIDKRFSREYRATIGLDILSHNFNFLENEVSISMWDIGAQAYFKRFRKTYYAGAQAAFIVFDSTNRQTFENVKIWYEELVEFLGKKDIPIVIIGNKIDLVDQKAVTYQDGVALASSLSTQGISKISYIETSALTGENIDDAFSLISYFYIQKSKEKEEQILNEGLIKDIKYILKIKSKLVISILMENPFWNPVLQILTELKDLGSFFKKKDEKEEKIYLYNNGLILKSYLYNKYQVSDSDGVFCIFDARKKSSIDPQWKQLVIDLINKIQDNKVILIGVRVGENADWTEFLEEFDVNEYLEKKMVSVLFFKIGLEYRLEIYDQLQIMLNSIKES